MLKIKRGDIILFILILFLSFSAMVYINFVFVDSNVKYAIIYSQGEEIDRFLLDNSMEGEIVEIDGLLGPSLIAFGADKVKMLSSTCPAESPYTCHKVGWITSPGEIIVCLPNQTFIKIESYAENGVDDIVY